MCFRKIHTMKNTSKPNRVRHAGGQRFPSSAESRKMTQLAREGIPLSLCAEACGYLRTELEDWLKRAAVFGHPRAQKPGDFDIQEFAHAILQARAEHQIELVRRDRDAITPEGVPTSQLRTNLERWLRFVDPDTWRALGSAPASGTAQGEEISDAAFLGRIEASLPALRAKVARDEEKG